MSSDHGSHWGINTQIPHLLLLAQSSGLVALFCMYVYMCVSVAPGPLRLTSLHLLGAARDASLRAWELDLLLREALEPDDLGRGAGRARRRRARGRRCEGRGLAADAAAEETARRSWASHGGCVEYCGLVFYNEGLGSSMESAGAEGRESASWMKQRKKE